MAFTGPAPVTLIKEHTGHGTHAARKAMTDYIVRNGDFIQDIMDMLGHRSPETAKQVYEVFVPQVRREKASADRNSMREADAKKGPRRNLATGRLVDPKKIYQSRKQFKNENGAEETPSVSLRFSEPDPLADTAPGRSFQKRRIKSGKGFPPSALHNARSGGHPGPTK